MSGHVEMEIDWKNEMWMAVNIKTVDEDKDNKKKQKFHQLYWDCLLEEKKNRKISVDRQYTNTIYNNNQNRMQKQTTTKFSRAHNER